MSQPEALASPVGVRDARRHLRDALWLSALSLVIRGLVVVWARDRFPPADDGTFYHAVAQRIAHGAGYTWQWPDGAVTYAAHYPVGYPALIALFYAVFGAAPVVAMSFNAGLGALSVFAAQRIVARRGSRAQALIAGLLLALHPGLVFYTPALMTEGVAAELLVVAAWLALSAVRDSRPFWGLLASGVCAGVMVLIRPQLLLLIPSLGFFSGDLSGAQYAKRFLRALTVTGIALAVCLPWTFRNCVRMDRCVFVSANGGWNLLIGSDPEGNGAWLPIEGARVPAQCREVFGEADKDRCFGHAGAQRILSDLPAFLALVPRKLAVTFDYFGAPGHYLHTSNYREFDETRKVRLGVAETVWERLVLLFAIAHAAWQGRERRHFRWVSGGVAGLFALSRAGWLGYLGLVLTIALAGRELLKRPLSALGATLIASTAATHALFFGAGRYGFVCAALLCVLAVGECDEYAAPAD